MKKICIIIGLLMVFLCGCDDAPKQEETWALDFDAMDKEFGQYQESDKDDTAAYEGEMDKLYANVESYVDFIMKDNAKGIVDTLSTALISYLGEVNGVSYPTAIEMAEDRVLETFEKTDIKDLYDGWNKKQHKIEISRIKIFSQRAELKEAYRNFGIRITDAVEVEFKVIVGNDERKSQIRLIQNENGSWGADADYFF